MQLRRSLHLTVVPGALSMPYFLLSLALLLLGSSTALAQSQTPTTRPDDRPNVLFIAIDDLRTNIGAYGDPIAITPNIDALAEDGLLFNRAYCQQAVCNPSRQSLLTGRRPDTIQVWNLVTHFRDTTPDCVTLPEHFKNHGYYTASIGKIFHGEKPMADPPSWSVPEQFEYTPRAEDYQQPQNHGGTGKHAALEVTDAPDDAYSDGKIADAAVSALQQMDPQKPFFLAVGFRKPHLPFTTPKKYWDLYPEDAFTVPDRSEADPSIPAIALHDSRELRGYTDVPEVGPIPDEQIVALRHGYYACTSFTDALIGQVVDELDRLGLRDNTIIVLWSDHGFHLGEQGLWVKTTNFELDTRVPLILSTPDLRGRPIRRGETTDALVELVDVFPTLTELCGLPMPEGLEGVSMAPLLSDPQRPWKTAAFSQFPRPWRIKGGVEQMGYSIRTDRHRYTQWVKLDGNAVVAEELYDHDSDPEESTNLAGDPTQASTVARLREQLAGGWKAARPGATVGDETNGQ